VKTPISSIVLVLIGSFIGSFGAVFLKAGAHTLRRTWQSLFLNWKLGTGVAMFLLSSVFFVLGVKHGELTILYPLVSIGQIWTLIWSRLVFKEPFTTAKFAGLGMILFGVVLLNLGNK
jgi:multidrug transporter EmrE-like cation transporter